MFAIVSSTAGLVIVAIAWQQYLAAIPKERVPAQPAGFLLAMAIGSVAAITGIVAVGIAPAWSGAPAVALGASALGFAGFFVYLLREAALPDGELVVRVGDRLPAFTAFDANGARVDSSTWDGQRVLLKFFRGHW